MAITKQKTMDSVTIKSTGHVEIRMTTVVFDDDGSELARNYFRRVINPSDDITNETTKIKQICQIARS